MPIAVRVLPSLLVAPLAENNLRCVNASLNCGIALKLAWLGLNTFWDA